LAERVADVRSRIARASRGQENGAVELLAVVKTRTAQEVLAVAALVDSIGDNRVQEAERRGARPDCPCRMIGHLQSNKVKKAAALFDSIDSIDSTALALALNSAVTSPPMPVLIEVNTSGEASKTGVTPEAFPQLLDCVLACGHLRLDGLMTIGPNSDERSVRAAFALLRRTAEDARQRSGLPLPVLSMGMSGDFEWAVMEGSTRTRIGTAIFGPRTYHNV
jgi:pyridoxal phosphate enzyme (YggS family)